MIWYLAAIATASLLGSLHCVGMCGPLALWAGGAGELRRRGRSIAVVAYHLGRGFGYVTIGALAGWLGHWAEMGGQWFGWSAVALRAAGVLMLAAGIHQLAHHYLVRAAWNRITHRAHLAGERSRATAKTGIAPGGSALDTEATAKGTDRRTASSVAATGGFSLTRWLVMLRPAIFGLPLQLRGLLVGLLTAMLPCGWLYVFAITALATGDPGRGALVMVAFWAGSLPALVALVIGSGIVTARFRSIAPIAFAGLLIVAGVASVTRPGIVTPAVLGPDGTAGGHNFRSWPVQPAWSIRLQQVTRNSQTRIASPAGSSAAECSQCPQCETSSKGVRSPADVAWRSLVGQFLNAPKACCEGADRHPESREGTAEASCCDHQSNLADRPEEE